MSELPSGWIRVQIGEISEQINGKAFKANEWEEKGLPIIRIQNLNNSAAPFNYFNGNTDEKYLVKNGDLLFAWSGTPGTSFGAHIWKGGDAYLNQHIFNIKPYFREFNVKYYYYALKITVEQFIKNAQGTAGLAHITKKKFESTEIPLPPLNEQKRIVEKLDRLFANLDSLKTRLERVPELLKQFRQSVLTQAVTGKLTEEWREINNLPDVEEIVEELQEKRINKAKGKEKDKLKAIYIDDEDEPFEIPKDWAFFHLDKLAESFSYGTSAKSQIEGKVPVLRMGNIQNGEIDWSDLKYSNDDKEIAKYSLEEGDVIFNRTNSPELVGKTAIYKGRRPCIYAGYLIKIKSFEELNSDYLNYALNSPYARSWSWNVKSDGVSQSNINAQKLSKFVVPFPSLVEQNEIVRRVKALFAIADNIEERYEKLKAQIAHLPQAILAKAFRGELVSQDPNDESAEELLKKIQQEKKTIVSRQKKSYTKTTIAMSKGEQYSSLVEALEKNNGRLTAKELWSISVFKNDIEKFYEELKKEVEDNKTIKESTDKNYLELA